MKRVKSRSDMEMAQEVMIPEKAVALGCLPRGQIPNREGFREPVFSGGESRLTQMMREYARERWVDKADYVRFYGRD